MTTPNVMTSNLDIKNLPASQDGNEVGSTNVTGTLTLNGIPVFAGGGGGSVTNVSVATANGFNGSVANPTSTPAISVGTTVIGIPKGNGVGLLTASSGTDYAPGTSALATGIVKSTTGTGALSIAISGDDYSPGNGANATGLMKSTTGTGAVSTAVAGTDYSAGTAGLSSGLIKSATGTGVLSTALSGTDYSAGTAALATGILKSTTTSGALSIAIAGDFPTLNQNTSGTAAGLSSTLVETSGGTNQSTYATGDTLYASGVNTLSKRTIGSNGDVLTVAGGVPTWAAPVGSGSVTTVSVVNANGFDGTIANASSTPAITLKTTVTGLLKGNATAISAATSGTDYSAGTSALATGILKSTTTSGALSIASAGDFPTLNQNTSGTAAGLSSTLVETSGGTNQTTYATGDMLYASGANTLAKRTIGSSGDVLKVSGGVPTWAAPTSQVAGANTQVQFNNAGAFGASTGMTWNGTTFTVRNLSTPGNLITLSGDDNTIIGDFNSATVANRTMFVTSNANQDTFVSARPNGTSQRAGWVAENNSTTLDNSYVAMLIADNGFNALPAAAILSSRRGTGTYLPLSLQAGSGSLSGVLIDINGNVVIGGTTALATSATNRFLYLNSMAGTPSGVPTVPTSFTAAGKTPITVDSTNNKLYFYTNSAWRDASATQVAGANTEVQFNNAGAFGASANLTWDGTTLTATKLSTTELTFSGTGRRIIADMDSATAVNRFGFQTSTVNAKTIVEALPNGTSAICAFQALNNSTATNASAVNIQIDGSNAYVASQSKGSGTLLPLVFGVANSAIATTNRSIGLDNLGNIVFGNNVALATSATDRFPYIPTMAGTPSGVPTAFTGKTPITVDSTNKRMYFYQGAWQNTNTPDYDSFTASAAQTVFNTTNVRTVANAGGKSFIQVFVNGVKQMEGGGKAYTVTGTTQITFNAGVTLNSDVEVYGFS